MEKEIGQFYIEKMTNGFSYKSKGLLNTNKCLQKIEGKLKFIEKIITDITLFNKKGVIYNKIYIYEKNGKIYSYNNKGENIFVNGFYGDYVQNFNLIEKDGKILLQIGLSGANYYFLENGKQYFPNTTTDKIIKGIKNVIIGIIPYFK